MYLAKVEVDSVIDPRASAPGPGGKWRDWPASRLSHHGKACCNVAREWVLAMDHSQLGAGASVTGPRWLRHRYPWGPSPWPLHWCEAVASKHLDCGAHAAIAHEIFQARGVESFPAQLVQQYSPEATLHWGDKWRGEGMEAPWIDGDVIYHEGCAVLVGPEEIKLWDASAGWWVDPSQSAGYGSLLSLRVFGPEGKALRWGGRPVSPGRWTETLPREPIASAHAP